MPLLNANIIFFPFIDFYNPYHEFDCITVGIGTNNAQLFITRISLVLVLDISKEFLIAWQQENPHGSLITHIGASLFVVNTFCHVKGN